tara:strand:- start:1091 stop:1369 length:279 start_codon:yes stop_codon:yes gene_type:complete
MSHINKDGLVTKQYRDYGSFIPMPVYYWEHSKDGKKNYDLEEMANVLEQRICECLGINVLITISENVSDETILADKVSRLKEMGYKITKEGK